MIENNSFKSKFNMNVVIAGVIVVKMADIELLQKMNQSSLYGVQRKLGQ